MPNNVPFSRFRLRDLDFIHDLGTLSELQALKMSRRWLKDHNFTSGTLQRYYTYSDEWRNVCYLSLSRNEKDSYPSLF